MIGFILLGVVVLVAACIGGYALVGSAQIKKLSDLTAKEALAYTLKGKADAVVTIGALENGQASYTVYGANGQELPPTLHTYEIGSLTKTFTAAMICRAVQAGKISLDAPIDAYLDLPEEGRYPTVGALVTHTSGYRGFYMEPIIVANRLKGRNDFYGIGDSTLLDRLGKTDIASGEHGFVYSNFGYATLGLILEKVYQTEFTTLLNGFAREELGLINTRVSDGRGDLGRYWDWLAGDVYIAAGALTSDITDMLRYAARLLENGGTGGACLEAQKSIHAATPQQARMGIRMDEIAFGWLLDNENGLIWHNGGTGGYNCYLGLDMQNQRAVVVLSNLPPTYRIPATIVGIKLLLEAKNR